MQKRLFRSRSDKMVAGICGGLAKYFELEPAIVRIIFLLLFFFKGIGFLVYLIMWIVVPYDPYEIHTPNFHSSKPNNINEEEIDEAEIISEKDEHKNENREKFSSNNTPQIKDNRKTIGLILIVLGGIFILNKVFPSITFDILLPLIFIAVGLFLIIKSNNGGKDYEAR